MAFHREICDTPRNALIRQWLIENRELAPEVLYGSFKKLIDKAVTDGMWKKTTARANIRGVLEKFLLEAKVDDKIRSRGVGGCAAANHRDE